MSIFESHYGQMARDEPPKCLCGCEDCCGEAVWIIIIKKEYKGQFGKKQGPYCGYCLTEEIEGLHTGGGLHEDAIKKIRRRR